MAMKPSADGVTDCVEFSRKLIGYPYSGAANTFDGMTSENAVRFFLNISTGVRNFEKTRTSSQGDPHYVVTY